MRKRIHVQRSRNGYLWNFLHHKEIYYTVLSFQVEDPKFGWHSIEIIWYPSYLDDDKLKIEIDKLKVKH